MLYSQTEKVSVREFLAKKPWWVWSVIVVVFLIGSASSVFGVYQLVNTNDQEIVTSADVSAQVCEKTPDFGQISVYISGAVVNPGVYVLENGDRVADVLEAAQGITSSADVIFVHRQLNLAKKVSDGEQLYIPSQAEAEKQLALFEIDATTSKSVAQTQSENSQPTAEGKHEEAQTNLIKINSSTKDELMELSGIGTVKAEKIIANRPYTTLLELVEKGAISQTLFDEIKAQISL